VVFAQGTCLKRAVLHIGTLLLTNRLVTLFLAFMEWVHWFEYLEPLLVMPDYENTLLDQTSKDL